jgi:hypothetical protein
MVVIAVLSVVVAVAVPGYQTWLIVFGGALIGPNPPTRLRGWVGTVDASACLSFVAECAGYSP